ncbi:MAG: hypothetical protein C0623_03300 [Desulfuromonas sp.]|nr:MAG: hypothetical protein C0623_03300 [Desulfuromonas sp.]
MKMKFIPVLVLVLLFFPASGFAAGWTGNVNGFLGAKSLDEDDWEPLDEHGEIGVRFDFAPKTDFPINFAIDWYVSGTSEAYSDPRFGGFADVDAATSEFAIGFRKYMPIPQTTFSPYLGAGLTSIAASIEADDGFFTYKDDDVDGGLWLEGGIVWTIRHVNLGLCLRYSDAEVTLFGEDLEVGGGHAGLIAGFHW